MHTTTNNGTGRPVVLIHGNSLSSATWRPQLEAKDLKECNVIAVDLPGHGSRARNPDDVPYSLEAFALGVIELISDLDDVVLVGHSLGGHIALRTLGRSPNIRGLFLFGMAPLRGVVDMAAAFQPLPVLSKAFSAEITEDDARQLATLCTWPESPYMDSFTNMFLQTDPRARAAIGAEIASGQTTDEQKLIRSIGIPVCMAFGENDPLLSFSFLEAQASLFWRQRVHVFKGSGHSPQLHQPSQFNELLIEFIKSV